MLHSPILAVELEQDRQFCLAFEQLRTLIDWAEIDREFPTRGNAVFTNSVVILMLLYQRMCPDKSLEATVKRIIEFGPHLLPQNKRVTQGTLSSSSGAYAKRRKVCPLEAVRGLAERVSQVLIDTTSSRFAGRRVYVFDGTTLSLAPESTLRSEYPPARNQFGATAFPTALLVMAFELETGCAVRPSLGAMYGPAAVSETALVEDLFQQLPRESVVMGDAGFGIFAVAWQARRHSHDFLLRLSASRFQALKKQARLLHEHGPIKTSELSWRPSAKERKSHPDLPPDAEVKVRLHEVQISDTLCLYLVTSLTTKGAELAELYRHRNDAEIDIRNFKAVLNSELSRVKSVEMFQKELWMSMVSYNLVCQFRREAALQAKLPPRRLSFKRVLTTYEIFLLGKMLTAPSQWRGAFDRALRYAMQDKLPIRPNRTYEREAYHQRPKSAQFKKRIPKAAALK